MHKSCAELDDHANALHSTLVLKKEKMYMQKFKSLNSIQRKLKQPDATLEFGKQGRCVQICDLLRIHTSRNCDDASL